jgi:hypothetical protein
MKNRAFTLSILVIICLMLTSCGAGQTAVPTFTPAPTLPPTLPPTQTLTPTAIPTEVPTLTPTPAPGKIYGKVFVDGTNAPIVTEVILGEFAADGSGSATAKLFEGNNFFTGDASGMNVLASTKISLTTDTDGSYAFEGLKPGTLYKMFVVLAANNKAFSACKTISLPSDGNWTYYVTFINGLSKPPVPAGEVLKELMVSAGDSLERNLAISCNGKGSDGSFAVRVH